MDNKGRIVIFISLMTMVYLIVITAVLHAVIISTSKSKAAIASRLAASDIKACYNSYIFEHYHILLFDKSAGGKGEAYLEEKLRDYYAENLGTSYEDTQTVFTEFTMLQDNACAAFREQMREYISYAFAEQGVQMGIDAIREKTGGRDGTLPQYSEEDMKEAEKTSTGTGENPGDARNDQLEGQNAEKEGENNQTDHRNGTSDSSDANDEKTGEIDEDVVLEKADDPRDYTKQLTPIGIMAIVMPEDKTVSAAEIQPEELPSVLKGSFAAELKDVNRSFDEMEDMTTDLKQIASWNDSLFGDGIQVEYIKSVFNSFLEEKNDTSVLQYEQEYLIAGKKSDCENLKSVMNRIIGIRFPLNYASLCAQSDKMAKLGTLAASLCVAVPVLIPTVKYLLAGCWAYIESIADTRLLFAGEKVAFTKTSKEWITDIDDIENSIVGRAEGDDKGLDYQDYLTIMQLMNSDTVMYRMLDLMQVNARQDTPAFRIKNAACGFEADYSTRYEGETYLFHQSVAY